MEVGDIKFYKERWKAVEEIERQELRALTMEQRWQKINALFQFALETGMKWSNDGEVEVFQRWVIIKEKYETGQKPRAVS